MICLPERCGRKMEMKAKTSRHGFAAGAKYAMHAPYRDLKRGTLYGRRTTSVPFLLYFSSSSRIDPLRGPLGTFNLIQPCSVSYYISL